MRTFFTFLGLLVFSQVNGQICPAQLESVALSSWSATQNTSYVEGDLYLDALNEPQYDGIWTLGTGVSNANLSVAENSSISAFIGVKRRNVVAPNDNIEMSDNVYNVEPGYSPLSQGSQSLSDLANWNFLLYANLGEYTFEDVDIRLYMDLDPCYTAQVDDMVEIDVAGQFQNFFGNANFSAFGINQNLASNFVQAFDSENIVPFDPSAEGYYTLAVGIYDVCGNLKLWHEVLVNVSSSAANDAEGDGIADDQELEGCNNPLACNFNCAVTENDGSCDFSSCYGCTVEEACNFDANATVSDNTGCIYPVDIYGDDHFDCSGECLNDADSDGICDQDEVVGCMDTTACNFDSAATDPGVCDYPAQFTNCNGDCLNDSDEDGICDEEEVLGCTANNACNFDSNATDDDGSCDFSLCAGCTIEEACNFDATATIPAPSTCLFPIDSYGASNVDCTGACLNDADQDGVCDEDEVVGCQDSAACNFNDLATDEGTCEFPVDIYGVSYLGCDGACLNDADDDGVCDENEILGCTETAATNYNPNATEDDDSCEASIVGCMLPWATNYSIEATVQGLPVVDVCSFAVESPVPAGMPGPGTAASGCTDIAACNYAPGGDPALPCDYSCLGCTNPLACDYSEDAVYNTGCTDFTSCAGCLINSACNYDGTATINDNSCEFTTCAGCMNAAACNFDVSATISASSTCLFPGACDTCSGATDGTGSVIPGSDSDGDGVCDDAEVSGCTDSIACNYDPAATENDGNCDYTSCAGCLDAAACNYEGTDLTITLSQPIDCIYPEAGLDCDGNCLNDTDEDGVCDDDEIPGCTDALACNFNPAATDDDGTCFSAEDEFGTAFVNCDGDCLLDEDGDGVCDQEEVFGCDIILSCNYNPAATENDGSCEFQSCTDCKDATACNYNPEAILSDNLLCIYDTNPELVFDAVLELNAPVLEWSSGDYLTSSEGAESVDFIDYPGRLEDGRYNVTRIYTATSLCGNTESAGQLLIAGDEQTLGCTNSLATNYSPDAINDDGTCSFDPACLGDLNDDSIVGATDLLMLLSAFGVSCDL